MNIRRDRRRYRIGILAVLIVAIFGLTVPMIVGLNSRNNELLFAGAKVLAASSGSFTLVEPVKLMTGPDIVIRSGTVSLADASDQRVLDGRARAALLLSGRARLVIDNAVITIGPENKPASEKSENLTPIAPFVSALGKLAFDSLRIRRGTVIMGIEGGPSEILSEVNATAQLRTKLRLRVAGHFSYKDEKLDFQTLLGRPSDPADPLRRPLAAAISGAHVKANVDGIVTLGEDFKYEAESAKLDVPSVGKAARWLGTAWPESPELTDFSARGHLLWQNGRIFFHQAKFTLGKNSAMGALGFSARTGRPVFDGTLAFETLKLTHYVEAASDEDVIGPRAAVSAWWPPFSHNRKQVWLPFIRDLDADLRISAARIETGELNFGRSAASITINKGRLLADIAEAHHDGGGRASGQLSIEAEHHVPRYAVRGKIEGLDISRSANALFAYPVVEGIGAVSIDLTATGSSQNALRNSCTGKINIELNDGAHLGVDIARLKKALGKSRIISGWSGASQGKTELDSLKAHLTVANGELSAQAITARAGTNVLAAAGSISLLRENLDLNLWYEKQPQVLAATNVSSQQAEIPETNGIRPIQISGPWIRPQIRKSVKPTITKVPRSSLGGPTIPTKPHQPPAN